VHAQMRGQCIMGSASTAVLARLIPSTLPLAMPTLLVVNVGGMYYYYDCLPSRPHLLRVRPWLALILPPPNIIMHHVLLVGVRGNRFEGRAGTERAGRAGLARPQRRCVPGARDLPPPLFPNLSLSTSSAPPPATTDEEMGGGGGGRKGRVGKKGRRKLTSRRVRARQESGGG
jgi:hypothetical protein